MSQSNQMNFDFLFADIDKIDEAEFNLCALLMFSSFLFPQNYIFSNEQVNERLSLCTCVDVNKRKDNHNLMRSIYSGSER